MAVEIRYQISEEITERGIYYATISANYNGKRIKEDIVFARYSQDRSFRKFLDNLNLGSLGVKEKANQKFVVTIKVEIITFLSNVNIDTFNQWKTSRENFTNNSTT